MKGSEAPKKSMRCVEIGFLLSYPWLTIY